MHYPVVIPFSRPPYSRQYFMNGSDLEEPPLVNLAPRTFWFVDKATGVDTNDGRSWEFPKKTIQGAIDKATHRDVIMVKALRKADGSYQENLTITSIDHLTIVGVGSDGGYGRPDIDPSTGKALVVTKCQGLTLANLRFYSSDSDVVTMDSNGFYFYNCVFDGDTSMAATEALLLLYGNASDDDFTASEGVIEDCLFRNSNGYGIAIKPGDPPTNGVGSTHLVVRYCRFIDNVAEDIITLANSGAAYGLQDSLFERCFFMGAQATKVDIQTNFGSANTGNVFASCYFRDDDITATIFKAAGSGVGLVGCMDRVGIQDGSALD